jgi:hypothetical protein
MACGTRGIGAGSVGSEGERAGGAIFVVWVWGLLVEKGDGRFYILGKHSRKPLCPFQRP